MSELLEIADQIYKDRYAYGAKPQHPMTLSDFVGQLRERTYCSVFEAKRAASIIMLEQEIYDAESIHDIKEILYKIVRPK